MDMYSISVNSGKISGPTAGIRPLSIKPTTCQLEGQHAMSKKHYTRDEVRIVDDFPNHPKFVNLTGRRFGRFTVLGFAGKNSGSRSEWWLECDCGVIKRMISAPLSNGSVKSCGCYNREVITTQGGKCKSKAYQAHVSAKARCRRKTNASYAAYGGRGIQYKFKDFNHFYSVVGDPPGPEYSLERKIVDGHYEPGNVIWATHYEQCRNKRQNVLIEIDGVTKCAKDWSIEFGTLGVDSARRRKRGWCSMCSVIIPKNSKETCPHIGDSWLK